MPENLWAPWRLAYVSCEDKTEHGCFLCRAASEESDAAKDHVIARGDTCLCIMNRFPYNNGHLLVSPLRHEPDLTQLTGDETTEMMRMISTTIGVLRRVCRAQGFNIGWNLGACAGAGIEAHLHAHIVPRWPGDTNIMPVIADVKVIPQALDELWRLLREAWPREKT